MTGASTRTDAAANEWAIDDDVIRLREWGTDTIRVLPAPPTREWTVGSAETCALRLDDPSGQLARRPVRLDLRQVALKDRGRGALAEVSLEDGGQRDPTAGPQRPNAIGAALVSSRHRRPGR